MENANRQNDRKKISRLKKDKAKRLRHKLSLRRLALKQQSQENVTLPEETPPEFPLCLQNRGKMRQKAIDYYSRTNQRFLYRKQTPPSSQKLPLINSSKETLMHGLHSSKGNVFQLLPTLLHISNNKVRKKKASFSEPILRGVQAEKKVKSNRAWGSDSKLDPVSQKKKPHFVPKLKTSWTSNPQHFYSRNTRSEELLKKRAEFPVRNKNQHSTSSSIRRTTPANRFRQ